ncbi:uncharacterized protein LOC127354931 [Dicentrarchus labrax]|uniref:uncharacterized protein LOC127354931 n=1 Tax=Dicentrarchus labrax TaxID=13489 RepID=UPI0021F5E9F8|nr:uncharacterized protein LOC127354931 [Dicentrarchus labrax]
MKIVHVFIFCWLSVVCAEASAVLEVRSYLGGEVSIHCSGSWTADNSSEHYNMYFCKGVCSRENILIQTERKSLAVTRRGRYSMEVNRGDGSFNVTIKRLKRADAGRYHCGVGETFNVLYREVNLIVLNASTVPSGPPPSTTSLQTEAETLPQGSFLSSTAPSPATLPAAEEKTNQQAATKLTDTTVVIIVSVSLALLVCAIIPLIFYGHCRSNPEGQNSPEANKGQADYCEEDSTQAPVRLQSVEPDADPESSAQAASQYTAIYQALDPKSLD